MKKQQVIDKLEQAWAAFQQSYAGLTDEQMVAPGVTGDWSVKDLLAHVSWWEEEALKHLPHILQGKRPPRYSVVYGGIDAFNAQMTELKARLSLAEVLSQLDQTHQRLINYLHSASKNYSPPRRASVRRLRLDTYSHYPSTPRRSRSGGSGQPEKAILRLPFDFGCASLT